MVLLVSLTLENKEAKNGTELEQVETHHGQNQSNIKANVLMLQQTPVE
jgi:hypothetical protein